METSTNNRWRHYTAPKENYINCSLPPKHHIQPPEVTHIQAKKITRTNLAHANAFGIYTNLFFLVVAG